MELRIDMVRQVTVHVWLSTMNDDCGTHLLANDLNYKRGGDMI